MKANTPRPPLGSYESARKDRVNGTVNRFRLWRKRKNRIARISRRLNRRNRGRY
jgi:hypothetical protein